MIDVILRTAARLLVPLLLAFSVFLLLRGHNDPGGGFSGGLVAAAAVILYALAYDVSQARRAILFDPHLYIAGGLALALAAGLVGLGQGEPFLAAAWADADVPAVDLKLGTPLLFDIGVYFTVIGATLMIVLSLAEE